jgi:DeoR/GlpR family transcriptional regulator of sugar metabolism
MYSIERKAEIHKMLENYGRIEVAKLASVFATSKETIRRDLRELEEAGILHRTHGGAVVTQPISITEDEYPVELRQIHNKNEKDAICEKASQFIEMDDNIFVDNISTCLYLVKHIPKALRVTIVTNSIKLLLEAARNPNPNHVIVCLGGLFHSANLSIYGSITQENAIGFYPKKTFISCAGIHLPDDVFDSSLLEVDTKRMMLEHSKSVYLLSDSSKLNRTGNVFLSNLTSIDYIITDLKADPDILAEYNRAGKEVLLAR